MANERESRREHQPSDQASLVIDLLNSRAHGANPDLLSDLGSARGLTTRLFDVDTDALDETEIDALRSARESLFRTLTDPDAWPAFSDATTSVQFRPHFTTEGTSVLEQVAGSRLLGRTVVAVTEVLRDGSWGRIKLCANDYCAHAFYDTTRNRMQKWDNYATCGNRVNVAAYRARKK